MGKLFNYEGPVVQFLIKVFDVILANLLWAICSLPVITLGASTAAMYAVVYKVISGEDPQVLKCFLGAFKSNFKQATSIWLGFLATGLVIWVDLYLLVFVLSELSFLQKFICAVLAILAFVWLMMLLYVFPLLARFHNSTKQTIMNSYLIPLGNPLRSLGLLVLNVVVVLVSLLVFSVFGFGICAAVNTAFMNKIFGHYLPAAPETNASEA